MAEEDPGPELQDAYDRLRSTLEELERTNQELRATNEELQTTAGELRERTRALTAANACLDAVATRLGIGVALVDDRRVVRIWSRRASELWGVGEEDAVGRSVLDLGPALPVAELRGLLSDALAGAVPAPVVLAATDGAGRAIDCRISAVPLASDGREVRGAILLMESA